MHRRYFHLSGLLTMLAVIAVGSPYSSVASASTISQSHYLSSQQQSGTSQSFPETGKSVSGRFLDYWNSHGGLMQQGYPVSEEMQEKSVTDGKVYTVQYFERAVFELHPENAAPYDVLLSLLGASQYATRYPTSAPAQQPDISEGSVLFAETGHRLGGAFLSYWNSHGGLMQQGYPVSDPFTEISPLDGNPYTVQYFQRAVFELHPENQAPYNVLLSQLGTFRFKQNYSASSSTGAAVSGQDQDGDGIADAVDKCPTQPENRNGIFDSDGCPDTLDDFAGAVAGDLNSFWSQTFQASNTGYVAPRAITPYTSISRTSCGRSTPNNAFYCGPDNIIYYDSNFLQSQLTSGGDFAAAVIIAHEWGHLVQANLGILQGDYHSIDIELQADCLAGAWAKHAGEANELEAGDLQEGATALYNVGDPASVKWFSPRAHGTPQQREDSFNSGYAQGVQGCPIAGNVPPLMQVSK